MARTMLNENNLPKYFWAGVVNTSCYVLNRVLLRPILKKTPHELWKNKKPIIIYFKVFGCKCFILNTKNNLGKFDAKSKVRIFLGYSTSSKVITTQKVSFCAFNSLCFKHFCVVVLHLYPNWHVKDLAMTSNHICGYF